MEVLQIILGVILGILSIAIVVLVLFQQGSRAGIQGAISGAAETFLSKNKARTADAFFKRLTAIAAVVFFVLAVAATVVATIIAK